VIFLSALTAAGPTLDVFKVFTVLMQNRFGRVVEVNTCKSNKNKPTTKEHRRKNHI
jgi:hypothetical protein